MGRIYKTDTLLRKLALEAKSEHVRLNAIRLLLELESRVRAEKLPAKSGKTTSESSELAELIDADQSDQTSGH
jgi:DNA polymerase III sliding clamp (beta) subunit (PCNA family)